MDDLEKLKEKLASTEISKYDILPHVRNIQGKVVEAITVALSKKNEQVKRYGFDMEKLRKEFEDYKELHKLINENKGTEVTVRRTFKVGDKAYYIAVGYETKKTYKTCPTCKGVVPKQREGYTHHCNQCHTYHDDVPKGKVVASSKDVKVYAVYQSIITSARIRFIKDDFYLEEFKDNRPRGRMTMRQMEEITVNTLYNTKNNVYCIVI